MDLSTLATTTVTFLSPYLVKAGEKTAEKIGEMLPAGVGKLWTVITRRFKGKATAEEAVTDLVAKPDDQLTQSVFAGQLRKVLEAEPTFVAELAQLLASVQQESGDQILNIGSGAVATRGGAAASAGGVAITGDVHGSITVGGAQKKE
jgi:hypothetical protein